MRVLIIHNHYQDPGGEDVVFQQEKALLEDTEAVFTLTFRNRKGWKGVWQTAWSPWNIWAAIRVKRAIRQYRPDVVHIHNLHYAVGPLAIRVAGQLGIPTVLTLHNYRLLCPSATLFHAGRIFTDSLRANFPWKAVRLGVHSGSIIKTWWLACNVWLHKKLGTWRSVNRYIVLTHFAKQLFVDSSLGVSENRIAVKPNFVRPPYRTEPMKRGKHFLFVGRLTEEKGVATLLQAFSGTDYPLRIAGDGPLRNTVLRSCAQHPNIVYLGALTPEGVHSELQACSVLIFPSVWYEGMPMTLIEAFSVGTSVIASDLGAMQAMVRHGENGWLFTAGDPNALRQAAAQWLAIDAADRQQLRDGAREAYERHYTPEKNKVSMLGIYKSVVSPSAGA